MAQKVAATTNPFETPSQAASPNTDSIASNSPRNPFDEDNSTIIQSPPAAHSKEPRVSAHPVMMASVRQVTNPFDDSFQTTPAPRTNGSQDRVYIKKHQRDGSGANSIISNGPLNSKLRSPMSPHLHQTPASRTSSSKDIQSPFLRHNTRETTYSLAREVRLREFEKQQDIKLRLERAKDEVARLSTCASQSTLPRTVSQGFTTKTPKNPIPIILTNGYFWAALLLAQTGLVSTAAAFAIVLKNSHIGEHITVGGWAVFWLVSSLVVFVIGVAGTVFICARKGNLCLGMQERMGFNEIRNVEAREADLKNSGAGLLYLGVGERDRGSRVSSLGVLNDNSTAYGRNQRGYFDPELENCVRDPMWRDLYRQHTSSASQHSRSGIEEIEMQDLNPDTRPQRSGPASTLAGTSQHGSLSNNPYNGKGNSVPAGEDQGGETQKEQNSLDTPAKSQTMDFESGSVSGWSSAATREVQNYSPLERLERALTDQQTRGSMSETAEPNMKPQESMETVPLTPPVNIPSNSSAKGLTERVALGMKWVSDHTPDFTTAQGGVAPLAEIIQKQRQKRKEEK
jgi:hypothetical protein